MQNQNGLIKFIQRGIFYLFSVLSQSLEVMSKVLIPDTQISSPNKINERMYLFDTRGTPLLILDEAN